MRVLFCLSLAIGLAGCSASSGGGTENGNPRPPAVLSSAAQLGEQICKDPSLSANGSMACSTCHDPENAFAAPAGSPAVPRGGPAVDIAGFRNAPSLEYLTQNTAFFYDDEGTPTGGFNRDGSADTLAIQAGRPFLAVHEMANSSVADVVTKLSHAPYANDFRALFGQDIFANPEVAFDRLSDANYFDLGICGPDWSDVVAEHPELCDAFKVPTLRNIALTAPYFHNGRFTELRDVLDIEDVIAFLATLTDGFQP